MKSTLSIACLLAFTIGVLSSEIIPENTDYFQCTNATVAQSCLHDIEKSSVQYQEFLANIVEGKENVVEITTHDIYETCAEFVNVISKVGNCTMCSSLNVNNTNPEYCYKEVVYEDRNTD